MNAIHKAGTFVLVLAMLLCGCTTRSNAQQEAKQLEAALQVEHFRVLQSGASCDGSPDRCLEFEAEASGTIQVPADAGVAYDTDLQEFQQRLRRAGIALKPGEAKLFRWDFKAQAGMCKTDCNAYLLVPKDSKTVYFGLYSF